MKKITFNPKETIAAVLNIAMSAGILSLGGTPEQAAAIGAAAEGIAMGINVENPSHKQRIMQSLKNAVEYALDSFELPADCKATITTSMFEPSNITHIVQSATPYDYLLTLITETCRRDPHCDITTLPAEKIANKIASNLHQTLINDPVLTGIYTCYLTQDMHKDIKDIKNIDQNILKLLNSRTDFGIPDSETLQQPHDSAKKSMLGFSNLLFAEDSQQSQKTLSDVYVESHLFSCGEEYTNFDSLFATIEENEPLLIEGEAGMGKSTLVMCLAKRYLTGDLFPEQNVYFVSGKEIRYSNGNPAEDLSKILGLPTIKELEHDVLILDAYDEIAYASQSQEQNQTYLRQLCNFLEGTTLIVTSRTDYIRNFPGTTARMLGFDCLQRREFLEKYNSGKREKEKLSDETIQELSKEHSDSDTENVDELLKIPMLLYMIAVSRINIHELTDRYSLYENVFGPKRRKSVLRRNRKISKDIWEECYSLAKIVAHQMYMLNDHYISRDNILHQIENLQLGTDRTETLKNCFGIEIFLRSEGEQLFTFVHNSIYEYFTAKLICDTFCRMLERWRLNEINLSEVQKLLNTIFNANQFENTIFRYIMENISAGYFTPLLQRNSDDLIKYNELMNLLITSQLCTSGSPSIPYAIRLKNMLLWVFDTFNMLFSMVTLDDNPYWVKTSLEIVSFLFRAKEAKDTLFLGHIDIENIQVIKADLGVTYLIESNLTGADFSYAQCDGISCINQTFKNIDFEFSDWSEGCLDNSSCLQTKLSYTNFSYAAIENSSFIDCSFAAADFTECQIVDCTFKDCDFRVTVWNNTIIHNCCFQNIRIYRSDLFEAFPQAESLNQFHLLSDEEDPDTVFFTASIDELVTL